MFGNDKIKKLQLDLEMMTERFNNIEAALERIVCQQANYKIGDKIKFIDISSLGSRVGTISKIYVDVDFITTIYRVTNEQGYDYTTTDLNVMEKYGNVCQSKKEKK